jgi:hypothetical protein
MALPLQNVAREGHFISFWGGLKLSAVEGHTTYQGDSWNWEDYERRRNVYDYYNTPWIEH